ncbi:MAG: FecR domain-containing protein [Opitutae bacterium]|nr:FecR domain-containing protein [Opitutae bacterium]
MNATKRSCDAIDAQANAWLARRDAGLTEAQRAEFARWRDADPAHARALAEAETVWGLVEGPATDTRETMRTALRQRARRRQQRRAAGACAAVAAVCLAGVLWWWTPVLPARAPHSAPTAKLIVPGRQVLPDGSVVELNAGSRIETDFSGALRRVRLLQGEAHFEVAKDAARPFVVAAHGVEVRAVGTAFAVRLVTKSVEVLVTEGRVAVERTTASATTPTVPPAPALVDAGNRLRLTDDAPAASPVAQTIAPAERDRELAWRWPRLEFTDTSIGEAVALFNGRNRLQLKVGDDAVRTLRVTGVFRADNVEGFVQLLESGFGLKAERTGETEILLRSAP